MNKTFLLFLVYVYFSSDAAIRIGLTPVLNKMGIGWMFNGWNIKMQNGEIIHNRSEE